MCLFAEYGYVVAAALTRRSADGTTASALVQFALGDSAVEAAQADVSVGGSTLKIGIVESPDSFQRLRLNAAALKRMEQERKSDDKPST
eukprot:SAG31_NODE_1003_length_10447_cov_3.491593_2_plen_89_part_00